MKAIPALARLRAQRGWTGRELARRAGIDPITVSDIETGRTANPNLATIGKLAIALEMEFDELAAILREPEEASA